MRFAPNVLLYAGDREDALVGAMIGAYLKIPTVHFFGGDHATDGNVDNPVRHAISKLSSLHFVSHESHVERLLKMGEPKRRIFNIGSPALDKYVSERLIERKDLLKALGRPDWRDYCHFSSDTCQENKAGEYFEEILLVLKELQIPAFVSYPNVDAGNRLIIKKIEKYANDPQFMFYKNMERVKFVNLMRQARFLIGNSSAGIMEAPIIPLGVINVGIGKKGVMRQILFLHENHTIK